MSDNTETVISTGENKSADVKNDSVPLGKFLEQKEIAKELKQKLSAYEQKEVKIAEEKMLEEKNFRELLSKKEQSLAEKEKAIEELKFSHKYERTKNVAISKLHQMDIRDATDGLAFINLKGFVDDDNIDIKLEKEIGILREKKPYLFKDAKAPNQQVVVKRNAIENDVSVSRPGEQSISLAPPKTGLGMLMSLRNIPPE